MGDYDIHISGGTIVDGTGVPRRRGDVWIKDGRVARIGGRADGVSDRVIDATGKIVAPGFVDCHTHYDAQIRWDPWCTISGWHGVTSVVLGNCGFGFAPVAPDFRDRSMLTMTRTEAIPYESMRQGMPWDWETIPEYLDSLDRAPKGVNVIQYMPTASLMTYVMGLEAAKSRPATDQERKEMQRLLHEGMEAGLAGFSIQRLGPDSVQADFDGSPMVTDTMVDEDILALAEVLAERDEGSIQITQAAGGSSEDYAFVEKLAEVAQRPVLYNVVTVATAQGRRPPQAVGVDRAVPRARACRSSPSARRAGRVRVHAGALEPVRRVAGVARRHDGHEGREDREDGRPGAAPGTRRRGRGGRPAAAGDPGRRRRRPGRADRSRASIASRTCSSTSGAASARSPRTEGKHPIEAMLDLSLAGDLNVEFLGPDKGSNAEFMAEMMSSPYAIPGVSDGGAHTKFFTGGAYSTDFLTWLVRDEGVITLEEAHYRLSNLAAQAAGFQDRGVLRQGAAADVLVYDLEELAIEPQWIGDVEHDLPGGEWRRVQRAKGYQQIIVNGEVTFEDGECTGATPGSLLRGGRG